MKKLVWKYLRPAIPKVLGLVISLGSILLWRRGLMKPGGAYLACSVSVMFVTVMNRVEQIRVELLQRIDSARAGG